MPNFKRLALFGSIALVAILLQGFWVMRTDVDRTRGGYCQIHGPAVAAMADGHSIAVTLADGWVATATYTTVQNHTPDGVQADPAVKSETVHITGPCWLWDMPENNGDLFREARPLIDAELEGLGVTPVGTLDR